MRIILPKKVYAPGEQLNLVVEILNDSDFSVASINTGIISLVYCKGQATFGKTTPVTKEEKEVIKSQEEVLEEKINVEPDSFYKYTRTIIVPKLVPNVFDSNIITTVHTVYITIHSSSNTVLIGSIPIVISTHISHSEPHQSQSAHAHLVPPPRFPPHHQHIEETSTAASITLKKHAPLTQKYSNASNASSIHSQKSPYSSLNTSTSSLTSNSSDSKPKKSVRFNDELNIKICNDNFISI
uniref:Arrestin C-terminal-like domain-containing protein n=1 Tax=Panagrolaimus sp. PS1159 TaxID=55785 RepID=A0AC35EX88_9BILA